MTFGEKLKKFRSELKLSQKAVADQIGVSLGTYGSYESDKRMPTRNPEVYDKLANLFHCEKDYLLGTSGAEAGSKPARRGAKKLAEATVIAQPVPAPSRVHMEIQHGSNTVSFEELVKRAEAAVEGDEEIKLYVKPEDGVAYYVCGGASGQIPLW